MTKDEIIAQGHEQMKRIPTLPENKTYTITVKNEAFNPAAVPNSSNGNPFSLFYFLRFRQITIRLAEGLRVKEFQGWEFEDFVTSRNSYDLKAPNKSISQATV